LRAGFPRLHLLTEKIKEFKKERGRTMRLKSSLLLVVILLVVPSLSHAWNYPRDGKFKQLHPHKDSWFFVDEENWDIKAPDKWQHFTGSYASQKLLSMHVNKYVSALVLFSFGVVKEYEDAYREGWSARDLAADALGILAAMYDKPNTKVLCTYDQERIMLNLFLPLR
jgi:hypothetical protein